MRRPNSSDAETIANPVTGGRIRFRESTDSALRFDYRLASGGFGLGKVDHGRPNQAERIAVESGRLGVHIDDEWAATPGTRFSVLPGTAHTIRNEGDDEMRAVIELRPGLELRSFFETTVGLAREGKTDDWGLPGPLQRAVLADEYREAFAFGRIPIPVQRALVGALAPVARLAGKRARYDRFGGERGRPAADSRR